MKKVHLPSIGFKAAAAALSATALFGSLEAGVADPPAATSLVSSLANASIDPAAGFRPRQSTTCRRGGPQNNWAYHCVMDLADGGRGGQPAALEYMIFTTPPDFRREDAGVKTAVTNMGGRWSLDYQPNISLTGGGGEKIVFLTACHQSRGQPNGEAYCLLQASANVLVFTKVAPAQRMSDSVTTNTRGGSDSFDDMAHASNLAVQGGIVVAKAQKSRPAESKSRDPWDMFVLK